MRPNKLYDSGAFRKLTQNVWKRLDELEKENERLRAVLVRFTSEDLDDVNMCPNCCTPWKCNGPHLSPEQQARRVLEGSSDE